MKKRRVPRLFMVFAKAAVSFLPLVAPVSSAAPLDEWSWRNTVPTSHGVRSIAEGNGILVAVADGPTFLRSSDAGRNWEATILQEINQTFRLLDVAFGNGLFVAVGNLGQVFSSVDGLTWSKHALGNLNFEFRSVSFGAGLFVMAGSDLSSSSPALFSSPDGITWSPQDGGISGQYRELVFENNEFIACGGNTSNTGFVTTSPNGTVWTTLVEDLATPPHSVTHGLGAYFTMTPGFPSQVFTSSDGSTWTGGLNNALQGHQQIRAFGDMLVSFDRANFFPDSTIRTSSDGNNWSPVGSVPKIHQLKVIGDQLYALSGPESFNQAAQAGISRSSDAAAWTALHRGWQRDDIALKAATNRATQFRFAGASRAGTVGSKTSYNLFLFNFEPKALLDTGSVTYSAGIHGIHSSSDGLNYDQVGFTPMNDITSGAGAYVAAGDSGNFSYSSDGSFWEDIFSGLPGNFRGLCYGNGRFVAVGDSGAIATSTDGRNWTSIASGQNQNLSGISHGAGIFVAVGEAGTILTSSDGSSWTSRTSGTFFNLRRVRHHDEKFRAVGKSGTLLESSDGSVWTPIDTPTDLDLCDIAWNGSSFLIVGQASVLLQSTDGTAWIAQNLLPEDSSGESESILCTGGGFLSSGDSGGLRRSPTGQSWFLEADSSLGRFYDFVSHEGIIIGVGERDGSDSIIVTSIDNGASWQTIELGFLGSFEAVTHGDGVFVAVGENNGGHSVIASSPDGLDWTIRPSGTFNYFLDVAHGNGLFVAVNGTREVVTSPDGITWTVRPEATSSGMNAIAFANGRFVGGFSEMQTSTDGIQWTRTGTSLSGVNGIAYGAGQFVAVANAGRIHTSPDGLSWAERDSPTYLKLWDVAYGNDSFIIVGFNGAILQSAPLASSPPSIEWLSPTATLSTESGNGESGSFYALSVTAKGQGPLAYQWFKDNQPIRGGDDYLLRLPLDGPNAGNYHVRVTNEQGQTQSEPVKFVVIEPEFRMELDHRVEGGETRVDLRISAPLNKFYSLYVIPIPGPPEWQYLDDIFVDQPNQLYTDYPFQEGGGRLYQLRSQP